MSNKVYNNSMTWKEYLSQPLLRIELIATTIFFIASLSGLAHFLNFVESRNGIALPDPVLRLFAPVNLTWLTFGLIYFSVFFTLFLNYKKPARLMFIIQTYILVVLIRMAVMYVVPLNPPSGMISLDDPFVQFFGTGQLLTKDLFFSGHTALMFLFFLVAENRKIRSIFLVFTIIVAVSVLLQHVHYTVDVLAAPFFTYACFSFVKILRKKIGWEFA